MKVDLFDFELPEEAIALRPVEPKDTSRMLVIDENGNLSDHKTLELTDFLNENDVIVFNDTKVIPAQLYGECRGLEVECNLHKRLGPVEWLAFAKKVKRFRKGDKITFGDNLSAIIEDITSDDIGQLTLRFEVAPGLLEARLMEVGQMPLPPYIASKRDIDEQDKADYQTIFAKREGAVAAPTASLHFTERLLEALEAKGVQQARLTLHVGAGTFLPVKVDDTADHKMHAEWGEISKSAAEIINAAKVNGGRVIAVGTTALRLLESAAQPDGRVYPWSGDTDIFITPGYDFKIVDVLMTNFHLPKSTLFMLVSAFAGLDVMKRAYQHAIDEGYRFYSYGDSSLIFRK